MRRHARAAVPEIRQESQFTCVAASIAACLQALDKPFNERDVNRVLGAEPLRGARWEEALATIQYFGCRGTLVTPSTLAMVREWTDAGKPVIIAWNPEGRPWSHASVIFDVTDDNVKIMDPNIPDPSTSVREVPHADFYKTWGEPMGDLLIVRRPALMVDVEVDGQGRQVRASYRNHPLTATWKEVKRREGPMFYLETEYGRYDYFPPGSVKGRVTGALLYIGNTTGSRGEELSKSVGDPAHMADAFAEARKLAARHHEKVKRSKTASVNKQTHRGTEGALRNRLIRLAHTYPQLRADILPLLDDRE